MTDAETTPTGVETATTDVETTMPDLETTKTDIGTTTTDVKMAMTNTEKSVSNVGTSVTQTTVTNNNVETTDTDAETAATEVEAAIASNELVNDPAAPQVVNNIDSPRTAACSPVDNNMHRYAVEPTTCTCVSAFLCCYGFIGETIRDLQAHFDGKVKAVCAYFCSKLEGIQTENAQLLELVKKYKSTADRCQSKLNDLLSRQKSEHDNSSLSVNEYAATKASATDTPPSLDQMRQTIRESAESQAKELLSASAQDQSPSEQECPPSSQKQ